MLGSGRKPVALEEGSHSESDDVDEPEPEEVEHESEMEHESWLDWIRRTTRLAEELFTQNSLDDWVTAVRKKKWRWAGHLARRCDGRWTTRLSVWEPEDGHRKRGRPCKKWTSDLDAFFRANAGYGSKAWMDVAQDRPTWQGLEAEFIMKAW